MLEGYLWPTRPCHHALAKVGVGRPSWDAQIDLWWGSRDIFLAEFCLSFHTKSQRIAENMEETEAKFLKSLLGTSPSETWLPLAVTSILGKGGIVYCTTPQVEFFLCLAADLEATEVTSFLGMHLWRVAQRGANEFLQWAIIRIKDMNKSEKRKLVCLFREKLGDFDQQKRICYSTQRFQVVCASTEIVVRSLLAPIHRVHKDPVLAALASSLPLEKQTDSNYEDPHWIYFP